MNHIFRVVWNAALGVHQAVAETGKAQGKGKSSAGKTARNMRRVARTAGATLAVCMASTATLAQSLPTGGAVVAGSGTIAQAGKVMTVTQTTPKLATDWQSFNIGAGNTVNFVQPSSSAVALNRVLGSDVSVIQGALNANGQVFLVNPNGVLFTSTAQVNVGSIVASTLAISTADFMAGSYTFDSNSDNIGGGSAIINQGNITATGDNGKGGSIALIAAKITNTGTLTANAGNVLLGAGSQVTLDLGGPVKLQVTQGAIDTLIENGGAIRADAGMVYLTAKAAGDLATSVINNTGVIEARSLSANAQGSIVLSSGHLVAQTGTLDASGAVGGHIAINTTNLIDAGQTNVSGQAAGGKIDIQASGRVLQTTSATLQANASAGNGGTLRINAGESAWLSGSLSATGKTGGDVSVTAPQLTLAETQIDASGTTAGGRIRVGGGWQGGDADLVNAVQTRVVAVQLDVSAKEQGNAGTAVVWSDSDTLFGGNILARGGANGGNGGQVEVSSHGDLAFGGLVDASAALGKGGQNGRLLLDPKNIDIVASVSGLSILSLPDPTPSASEGFGAAEKVVELMNGNTAMNRIVVASQYDDIGAANAGAVYLYNSQTGALVSTLTGSTANDYVGNFGVTALTNGNYVVRSASWNNGGATYAGAVTWGSGSSGISGLVTSSNSLVGSTTNDYVGSDGVTALNNGNYVVKSSNWDNGSIANVGAVSWGNGSSGISGVVTSSNSLVGSTAYDQVGIRGVTELNNGNYVVSSSNWNNGGNKAYAGAVTWGNGADGTSGAVTSLNSLVGSTASDQVGSSGVTALSNGNYVVNSPNWDNGSAVDAGAVTWGNGLTAGTRLVGAVTSSNSLIGSTVSDQVGNGGIKALSNGNYVVSSYFWDNGGTANVGAATWGNGTSGTHGVVTIDNSLVGSTAGDYVGINGVTALNNGNYVVSSAYWNNGGNKANAGAATWGNGTVGTSGMVSGINSLVGSTESDYLGTDVTALSNGNYVVSTREWDNGSITNAGAATWGDGSTAGTRLVGAVTSSNSLVGSTAGDQVGGNGVTALSNGNYVVASSSWANSSVSNAGAVTWGDGSTVGPRLVGAVSSSNSLVGSRVYDNVGYGSVTALSNGNYVVGSTFWDNGSIVNVGSVTWGNGNGNTIGEVSSSNSLVGSTAYDQVGRTGITALSNGNYVVSSSSWNNGGNAANAGAVTWGNGSTAGTRLVGMVTSSNSLVGSTAGDQVGGKASANDWGPPGMNDLSNGINALSNGNYVVNSSNWNNGGNAANAGAVTWGNGSSGTVGEVTSSNSLVGSTANDKVGSGSVIALSDGRALVSSPNWTRVTPLALAGAGRVDILSSGVSAASLPLSFGTDSGASSSLSLSTLLAQLNAGTNVILQASNDITLSTAVTVNNLGGNGGALTLQAGRSILLNANLSTDNGNLTLIANETLANGVVDADRDAGAAQITQAAGTTIDAGTGSVSVNLKDGAGLTNNTIGTVTLASITAASLSVASNGFTASATASNKTYDGNTNATLSTASLSGLSLQSGSNLSVVKPLTGSFADANAGNGKIVTSTAFGITGYNAALVSNLLHGGTALTAASSADISPAPVVTPPVVVPPEVTPPVVVPPEVTPPEVTPPEVTPSVVVPPEVTPSVVTPQSASPITGPIQIAQQLVAGSGMNAPQHNVPASSVFSGPIGNPGDSNTGGLLAVNGGLSFVEVDAVAPSTGAEAGGRDVAGFMRVFVVDGGINLPERARK
ncbi:MAG: filamentous hemagglutinin N-terminal domain-containing protein [Pseudomonas sp.]